VHGGGRQRTSASDALEAVAPGVTATIGMRAVAQSTSRPASVGAVLAAAEAPGQVAGAGAREGSAAARESLYTGTSSHRAVACQ
jgi:hypothetical protein